MTYASHLLSKFGKVLAALVFVPMVLLYWLAWGGIVMGVGTLGNDAYVMPLTVQAILWIALVMIWSSYTSFKERQNSEPSQTTKQVMVIGFGTLTVAGFYLAERYHGLYSDTFSDILKIL